VPGPRTFTIWSEQWEAPHTWLYALEAALRMDTSAVMRGRDVDRWDIEARRGRLGIVRLRMASEEHGQGKQRLLFRIWPYYSPPIVAVIGLFFVLSLAAALSHTWLVATTLGLVALVVGMAAGWSGSAATATMLRALQLVDQAGRERAAGTVAWRPPSHHRLTVIAGRGQGSRGDAQRAGEISAPRISPGRPPSGRLTRHDAAR
jgi:hypothetical protein